MEATIHIKGAEIALYFGIPAATGIFQNADYLSDGEKGVYNSNSIAIVLYEGYKNACLIDRKPETLQFRDFAIYAEDATLDNELSEIKVAFDAFAESKVYKKAVKVGEQIIAADDEKKSSPLMTEIELNDSVMDN